MSTHNVVSGENIYMLAAYPSYLEVCVMMENRLKHFEIEN